MHLWDLNISIFTFWWVCCVAPNKKWWRCLTHKDSFIINNFLRNPHAVDNWPKIELILTNKRSNSITELTLYQKAKSSVTPVCLPWSQDHFTRSLKDDKFAVVSGWGKTFEFGRELTLAILERNNVLTKKLRKLKVKIANKKCTGTPITVDQKSQLCAGGEKGK